MITEALVGAAFLGAFAVFTCIGQDARIRTKIAIVVTFAVAGAAITVAAMSVTRYVTGVITDEVHAHNKETTND